MKPFAAVLCALLAVACHGQYAKKDLKAMRMLLDQWKPEDLGDTLPKRFPGIVQERGKAPLVAVEDEAIKDAVLTYSKETVGPLHSINGTCAFVRILEHGKTMWARASYVYLNKNSRPPDALQARADSILGAIQAGLPFAEAANKFTMDGNKRGGDLGWFQLSQMVPEFSAGIAAHHKGDLFTLPVEVYGWYVVLITEEPGSYEHVQYVLARGAICPK
ncbi:MAG: peptidylprolyl isomerase [Flavobacteriales bacterium]